MMVIWTFEKEPGVIHPVLDAEHLPPQVSSVRSVSDYIRRNNFPVIGDFQSELLLRLVQEMPGLTLIALEFKVSNRRVVGRIESRVGRPPPGVDRRIGQLIGRPH